MMHPVRKQRLILVVALVVIVPMIVALAINATKEYGNLFYSVSEVVAGKVPNGKPFRAGGCVVPGSVQKAKETLFTSFKITDGVSQLKVTYDSLLPDLFAEGEAAVVTGTLGEDGALTASEVLAKHDENYTPPEVAETVQNTETHQVACEGMKYDS